MCSGESSSETVVGSSVGKEETETVTAIGPVLFLEHAAIDMSCIAAVTRSPNGEIEILFRGDSEPKPTALSFSVFMREFKEWCKQLYEPRITAMGPAMGPADGGIYEEYMGGKLF